MKVAVLSDIHSNLIALKLALEDIKSQKVDRKIFLGDYITDGPNPNEILDYVCTYGDDITLGNREMYMLEFDNSKRDFANYRPIVCTYESLSEKSKELINHLPCSKIIAIDGLKILLIHGNGYFSQYISEEETHKSCDKLIREYDFDICLFGHTHVVEDFEYKGRRFINPGSLGQPVDGNEYKYMILDIQKDKVTCLLRKFSTEKTFEDVRKELEQSKYYKDNKIWCEVILKMIETGTDYCDIFLKLVNELLENKNKDKISSLEFNEIWEEAYKKFAKI